MALPFGYTPKMKKVGFEPTKKYSLDLQSNAFNHSATTPLGIKGIEPLLLESKTNALPFGYIPK